MTDIKSINYQNIHSTQSAPAESSQKTSEIVKESKPAEFRPLTKEQQENIKQTRNAEIKLAESAIKAFFVGAPVPSETPSESHVHANETEYRMPEIFRKAAADSQVNANERKAWEIEHPADHHVLENEVQSSVERGNRPFNAPGLDPLPIETGPLGKLPEFTEFDRQLPVGTGPTGDLPDLDDLKSGLRKVDKYLNPVTDVIREKIKGDS